MEQWQIDKQKCEIASQKYMSIYDAMIQKMVPITISESEMKTVYDFAGEVIKAKASEIHHQKDTFSHQKRFRNGFIGELAIEKFLGKKFINWNVGESSLFNTADLKPLGLNIGIKTVAYPAFPVIHKEVKRPEIINIKVKEEDCTNGQIILVGVIAPITILQQYQDMDLLKDSTLKARGTKTGFYGVDKVEYFSNFQDLEQYVKSKEKTL